MKMMFKIIFSVGALVTGASLVGASAAEAGAGTLYTRDQILLEFFPGATVEKKPVELTPALALKLKVRLGYVPRSPDGSGHFPVWVGTIGGAVVGYAVIDDEKGMHEPITFAVLVGPDGAVTRQEVLVYRESEGDGITRKAFRRQFIGKTVKSPLRTGSDVAIVSGATISSNSMAVGVRRALAVVSEAFLQSPEAPVGRLPGAGL